MIQTIPTGTDVDPIACTWWRGLVSTALEQQLRPLCWHIGHDERGALATGYVTVSLLHEADSIRESWARHLDLSPSEGGYAGRSGALTIWLPNAVDPDERCRECETVFNPRSNQRSRHLSGDVCALCARTR